MLLQLLLTQLGGQPTAAIPSISMIGMDAVNWQLLVVPFVLLGLFVLRGLRVRRRQKCNEPPELPHWIPWNAVPFLRDSNGLIERALRHFRSSRPFSIRVAGETLYFLTDPQDVKALFRRSKEFTFDPFVEHVLRVVYECSPHDLHQILTRRPEYQNGLNVLDTTHQFYRMHLLPGAQYDLLVKRYLEELNTFLKKPFAKQHLPEVLDQRLELEVNLYSWVRETVATLATNAVFGPILLEQSPDILDGLWKFDDAHIYMVYGLPKFMLKDAYQARDDITKAICKYFASDIPEEQKMDMIWQRKINLEAGGLTPDGIAKLTMTILWAMQTNSVRVAFWMLYYIISSPTLATKIRAEIAPAFDATTQLSDPTHLLTQCPVLMSTYLEILRITSGSATSRVVSEDVVVEGYLYRAGGKVVAPSIQPHMDAGNWGEDVAEFRYDRFINPEVEKKMGLAYRPFGGGETHCPGRFFARTEILALIAGVLHTMGTELLAHEEGERGTKAKTEGKENIIDRKKPAIGILDPAPEFTPRVRIWRQT